MPTSLSTIQVEVTSPANITSENNTPNRLDPGATALNRLDPGATAVAGGVLGTLIHPTEAIEAEDLQQGIAAVCAAVSRALKEATPESWTVEFSLGFKAGAKVPVLMSGEANAALKVTLNWKKPAA